jgi:hypothetical protein
VNLPVLEAVLVELERETFHGIVIGGDIAADASCTIARTESVPCPQ